MNRVKEEHGMEEGNEVKEEVKEMNETTQEIKEEVKEIKIDNFDKIRILELDACTNCGECIKWCPVIEAAPELTLSISPPAKIRKLKKIITAQYGLRRVLFGKKDNFFNRIFRTPTITKEDMEHSRAYDDPWQQPRSNRARRTKVAKKEGRIKEIPKTIKPPQG